ncbi:glycosyltransferase family 1 protein [Phocaeicola abscessus]|uniref:glycosyltransferase family 4 protein n=1 Tax=Phocaeicola abscessus TaxID=555313 RepID=UPI000386E9C6|nr:glycosyltransferase family 1 protein [Phocaeicola abscessus]EPT33231.1 glycosyltransferase, group 1 family protein [Bacteroidetes bacterium oral taxon 272 str. F0290]
MIVALNLIALGEEKGTGAFQYITRIFKELKKFRIYNTHFIIYKQPQISESYIGFPDNLDVEYINVPVLKARWKRVLFEQTLFYLYLKKSDVFYSYCTSMPLFVRARKVFTLHDVYFITNKERYGWLQRMYLKVVTKVYVKRCDIVLTVSEYSKNEIVNHLEVPEEKIKITYNFIEKKPHDNVVPVDEIKNYWGKEISIDKPFFLFIGSIQPSKNVIGMVEGFNLFNTQDDFRLFIVGKLSQKGEKILTSMEGKPNIEYLGYQSSDIVNHLLAHCKCVVLLSLCEGFGIPPIEGFSYNKPALVSNLTSLPEVVGNAGIKVDPYDKRAIADGFRAILTEYDALIKKIPVQLSKFNPKESTSSFLDSLGIAHE